MPSRLSRIRRVTDQAEALGLPPVPVEWEWVSSARLRDLAALDGLPRRYGHWTFGQARMQPSPTILELVTYGDPIIASLDADLDSTTTTLVIAHVLGHAALFAHHPVFQHPAANGRQISQDLAAAVHRLRTQQGEAATEALLDALHVLAACPVRRGADPDPLTYVLNTGILPDALHRLAQGFDRERAYFAPIAATKLLHEGWATFWHRRILLALTLGTPAFGTFLHCHARILATPPHRIQPYALGDALMRAAVDRDGEAVFTTLMTQGSDRLLLARYGPAVLPRFFPDDPQAADLAALRLADDPVPVITVDSVKTQARGVWTLYAQPGRSLDRARTQAAMDLLATHIWRGPVELHHPDQSERWHADPLTSSA